jgi:hypothetical protein
MQPKYCFCLFVSKIMVTSVAAVREYLNPDTRNCEQVHYTVYIVQYLETSKQMVNLRPIRAHKYDSVQVSRWFTCVPYVHRSMTVCMHTLLMHCMSCARYNTLIFPLQFARAFLSCKAIMLDKAHPFFAVVLFGSNTLSFPPQVITAIFLLSHGISLLCIAGIHTMYI